MQVIQDRRNTNRRKRASSYVLKANITVVSDPNKRVVYSQRVRRVLRTKFLNNLAIARDPDQLQRTIKALIELDCKEVKLPNPTLQLIHENLRTVGFVDKEMWSTGKVAKKLGVSNQTVVNWINAGRLKGMKLPSGQYRVYADQFRTTDAQDTEFDAFFNEMASRYKDVSEEDLEDL